MNKLLRTPTVDFRLAEPLETDAVLYQLRVRQGVIRDARNIAS